MKKFFLTVAILLPAISICTAKHKKSISKVPAKGIISINMRHGACFGRCPDYSIEINRNGMATYTGFRFTKDSGVYEKKIGTAAAMNIIDKFTRYRVDTCQTNYPNRIPDLSSIYYNITYPDSVKKIYNAQGGPQFIRGELTNDMNAVGTVDDTWTKTNKAPKRYL